MNRRLKCIPAVCALSLLPPAANAAPTFLKSIDLSPYLPPATGVIPAHLAVDDSVSPPVLCVTTLNDSAATSTSIPALKIADPLAPSPAVSVLDTNSGNAGGGVSATRGYGGVTVDGLGNVFVCWTGNTSDDSARVRQFNASGTLVQEWLYTACGSQRWGGIDISRSHPTYLIGARFINSTNVNVSFSQLTTPNMTQGHPTTDATATSANPRDLAYDETSGAIYVNANGILKKLTPGSGGDITQSSKYDATNGDYAELINNGAENVPSHGIAVSPNGQLIGFSPNQTSLVGANTMRIVDPTGTLVETLGTLDTPGDGTGADLGRGVDMAFLHSGGANYVFVTDFDPNITRANRSFNRIAVYTIPQAVPVRLSGFQAE